MEADVMKDRGTSIIALCLSILAVIVAICVAVSSLVSINDLKNIDASKENLPGASLLVGLFGTLALWLGTALICGFVSSIGFITSLIGVKAAESKTVKRLSKVFLCANSLILLLAFCQLVLLFVL